MRFDASWAGVVGVVCALCCGACSSTSAPPAASSTGQRATPVAAASGAPTHADAVTTAAPPPRSAPASSSSATGKVGATGDRFIGSWRSPRCGARGYPRLLSIAGNGKASGSELVSPCRPGTRCVWSGVVLFSGTWSAEGNDAIALQLARRSGSGPAVQLPERLLWDAAAHAPAGLDGAERCAYEPAGAPANAPSPP